MARFVEKAISKLRDQLSHMINARDGGCGSYTNILGFGCAALCVQVPGTEHKYFEVENNEDLESVFHEFCAACLATTQK